jgi:hypothetical protein
VVLHVRDEMRLELAMPQQWWQPIQTTQQQAAHPIGNA